MMDLCHGGPIFIDGDVDFTPANGVTLGSGTADDPHIIENWAINASHSRSVIGEKAELPPAERRNKK